MKFCYECENENIRVIGKNIIEHKNDVLKKCISEVIKCVESNKNIIEHTKHKKDNNGDMLI